MQRNDDPNKTRPRSNTATQQIVLLFAYLCVLANGMLEEFAGNPNP